MSSPVPCSLPLSLLVEDDGWDLSEDVRCANDNMLRSKGAKGGLKENILVFSPDPLIR